MDISKLFQNTVVLSLPHRLDRRIKVKQQLDANKIFFEYYDAVNGHETEYIGPLTKGEHGIKMSHIKILLNCIECSKSGVLIFEDDIILDENFLENITKDIKNVPDDMQILYLGASHHVEPKKIKGNIYKLLHSYTTHAMYIDKSVFNTLIEAQKNNPHVPLDVVYAHYQPILSVYGFYPNLAWQKDDYSDIQNKFVKYDWLKPQ